MVFLIKQNKSKSNNFHLINIGIVKVVNFSIISLRKSISQKRLQRLLWDNFSKPWNIFIHNIFHIEILNQKISCFQGKMTYHVLKWLILVCLKISLNKILCIPWVAPHIILHQRFSFKTTIKKLTYGQWVLCCILCFQVKYHSQDVVNLRSYKMSLRVNSISTIRHSLMSQINVKTWLRNAS